MTDERARTNVVLPHLALENLKGTRALAVFDEQFLHESRVKRREEVGDFLHKPAPLLVPFQDDTVVCAFAALFQGDHLGVEFATEAHSRMLQSYGLLDEDSRLPSSKPLLWDQCVSGLVIDDFFVVSKEQINPGSSYLESRSVEHFRVAKAAYQQEGLQGSDDKDVIGQTQFTVCGGEVCSSEATVRRGAVTIAAPFEKRMALAMMTASASALPATSDALLSCLVGSWISVALLRRPSMSILDEVFKVIPPGQLDPQCPVVRFFPRAAASELQQLACLAPVLCSNLAVPFATDVFATDASMAKGGIVRSEVTSEEAAILWRTAMKAKSSSPVISRTQAMLSMYDPMFEENAEGKAGQYEGAGFLEEDFAENDGSAAQNAVPRPLGLRYEFIEICGGAAVVTKELIKLGVVCGPVIDVSISRQFDLRNYRVIEWIIFLLENNRLQSFLVSPPCTSFSPAAHPCVRSYQNPRGFNQENPKVKFGNQLAFAALALMMFALRLRMKKCGLLEQPRRSKSCVGGVERVEEALRAWSE